MKYFIIFIRKSPKASTKKSKESRVWALGGAAKDMVSLDYTKDKEASGDTAVLQQADYLPDSKLVGTLQGQVRENEYESSSEEEIEEEEEEENAPDQPKVQKKAGIFSYFK